MPASTASPPPPRSVVTLAGSVPSSFPSRSRQTLMQMQSGQLSQPIPVPGGISIIAVQDTRKVLTADPRNAVLSLKQVSITFPAGTSAAAAEPHAGALRAATQNIGGCGGADKVAADFKGDVVQSDASSCATCRAALQEMMLPMQVGQATRPFGSIAEGVRVLVICGRDEEQSADAPNPDAVFAQLQEERVNAARSPLSSRPPPRRRHRLSLRWP